jgi:peptide/nickel transport system permease protein
MDYSVINQLPGQRLLRQIVGGLRIVLSDRSAKIYFSIIIFVLMIGIAGPWITPYDYNEVQREDGEILRNQSPTLEHPLGTTTSGYDVLSRVLFGARPTVISGILGGALIITIGMTIGLTSGYVGGQVDNILMRFTDFIYGIPIIPFAIVLAAFFGIGYLMSILMIGLLLWRGSARVIRSQVLQIKERPFILAAKATGASTPRIILKHIFPNVASMAALYFALGVGWTIIIQAGLAFIGVTDPFIPSWGVMVRNAYRSGYMDVAWWWSVTPGLLIAITVLATFMFGRTYEKLTNQSDEAVTVMG